FISVFHNVSATTEHSTLSLHDALPIFHASYTGSLPARKRRTRMPTSPRRRPAAWCAWNGVWTCYASIASLFACVVARGRTAGERSEEHTSELQSRENLVCRLLLEKKKE